MENDVQELKALVAMEDESTSLEPEEKNEEIETIPKMTY